MTDLTQFDTLVVVFMENRSFDHMLGYLSLPPWNRTDINGLQADPLWIAQHENIHFTYPYPPFAMTDKRLPDDPPHERDYIALQIDSPAGPMRGFVSSYACVHTVAEHDQPAVMGYYTPREVPVSDFFARSFAVCDRWFAPLPASTQPNRLMAMSGQSFIDGNKHTLPEQPLVYDWLTARNVRWRVYHEGIPFFALMPKWLPEIVLDTHFRSLDRLVVDVQEEQAGTFPQVIFVEPTYTDAPHLGDASDDHPPSSIAGGQEFLRTVYLALTSKPERWGRTVMIVTYDEHGGFFDHVEPLKVPTSAPPGIAYVPFTTTGVRVPAFVLSPLVPPRSVYKGELDHTSILKLIGQKFGGGAGYSVEVDHRPIGGNLADLFTGPPRADVPVPPPSTGYVPTLNANGIGFQKAMETLWTSFEKEAKQKFPESWHFDPA